METATANTIELSQETESVSKPIEELPTCCRSCRFKSYMDDKRVYCGFCMKRILIELGYYSKI